MNELALENIATVQVGYQARTKIEHDPKGTHKIIQSKDIDEQHHLNSGSLMTFQPDRRPELYAVHKGDILFQARGVEHFSLCVEETLPNTLAAGSFYIIRVSNKDIVPGYLCWWLNQAPAQSYFRSRAGSSMISLILKSDLIKLKVKIPPKTLQLKIVNVIKIWRKEQVLYERLAEFRKKQITSICINAINIKENI